MTKQRQINYNSENPYTEALKSIGGEEAIEKFSKLSEDLSNTILPDGTVMDTIWSVLPYDYTERFGYSVQMINQPPVNSLEELMDLAKDVYPKFKSIVKSIAEDTSGEAVIPNIKGEERARAKAEFKYRDGSNISWHRLTDLVRATLAFETIEDMYRCVEKIVGGVAFPDVDVREFNDRYQKPMKGGYRDLQLVVCIENHMCEVQLTTKAFRETKEGKGHRDYEVVRELQAAVEDGALDRVIAVLNFGNEHRSDKSENTNKKILQTDPRARFLLHTAARCGFTEILSLLIENGANIDIQDDDGNTPLHLAIAAGHETTVWKLLHQDAKNQKETSTSILDITNKHKSTPVVETFLMLYQQPPEDWKRAAVSLFTIAKSTRVNAARETFKKVLKEKLKPNMSLVDNAQEGNVEEVRTKLRAFSDPNSARGEETALMAALRNKQVGAVKELINFNVRLDRIEGKTVIEFALTSGCPVEVFKILFHAKASVDPSKDSKTLLTTAIENKASLDILEVLVKAGAPMKVTDVSETLLSTALESNLPTETINYLIEKGAPISVPGQSGKSILRTAIESKALFDTVKLLVEAGAPANVVMESETLLTTALNSNLSTETIKYLIEKGAPVNVPDQEESRKSISRTALSTATIKDLLENGAPVQVSKRSPKTTLMTALESKVPLETVKVLVEAGAPTQVANESETLLTTALKFNISTKTIKYLVEKGAPVRLSKRSPKTLLMTALELKVPFETVKVLVEAGASIEKTKEATETLLMTALESKAPIQTIEYLIEGGATMEVPKGKKPLMRYAVEQDDESLAKGLSKAGVSIDYNYDWNIVSTPHNVNGKCLWSGAASIDHKVYFAPYQSSSLLMFDSATKTTSLIECNVSEKRKWNVIIECNVSGNWKWSDIIAVGSKLYCSPLDASSVLVYDSVSNSIHTIKCYIKGELKWSRMAEINRKVYCTPFDANCILVIDTSTETLDTIDVPNGEDPGKWIGMARYKMKLFCAPFDAPTILVIDTETNKTHTINCDDDSKNKWSGITTVGTKLICSPYCSSSVLIIDGETEVIRKVDIGDTSYRKWMGITTLGTNAICCPCNSSSVLIIDADSETTQMIECGHNGDYKWSGVTVVKDQLVFAPSSSSSVLMMYKDDSKLSAWGLLSTE